MVYEPNSRAVKQSWLDGRLKKVMVDAVVMLAFDVRACGEEVKNESGHGRWKGAAMV